VYRTTPCVVLFTRSLEWVFREAAVEKIGEDLLEVGAVAQRAEVDIVGGLASVGPPGVDRRPQCARRFGGQRLLLFSPDDRQAERQLAGHVVEVGRVLRP